MERFTSYTRKRYVFRQIIVVFILVRDFSSTCLLYGLNEDRILAETLRFLAIPQVI